MMRRHRLPLVSTICIACAVCLTPSIAHGASANASPGCASYICVIADSGLAVAEYEPDETRAPASMVKMVLMAMVAQGVGKGSWTLDTEIEVSKVAAGTGGARVFLKAGEKHSLGALMHAVAVLSANDAASAVACGLWGSESAYLKEANRFAKEIGMANSEINTVHGLPPEAGQKGDTTTSRDMAVLARQCVAQPLIMEWVSIEEYSFRDGTPAKASTNKLLGRLPGCDGLKTGYTGGAGYCITATAKREGIRLIAVVMGCDSLSARFDVAERILEEGFSSVKNTRLVARGQAIGAPIPVYNCRQSTVQLVAAHDVWAIIPQHAKEKVELVFDQPELLVAPMQSGTQLGEVRVRLDNGLLGAVPAELPENLAAPSWRWKLERCVLARREPVSHASMQ